MNTPPVIVRELTVASRRRETWILRLVFGIGTGVAFAFGVLLDTNRGPASLRALAIGSLVLCLFTGPYLTSDAISSEKREGTLGLLFLTPLNGLEIVLGKMVTHGLQVSYALLGTFPFLFLPLLLGGVTWGEVLRLVLVLLTMQLLSLACGMVWSTLVDEARSASLGTAVSLVLIVFAPMASPFFRLLTHGPRGLAGVAQLSPMTWLISAFDSSYHARGAPVFGALSGASLYWRSMAVGLVMGCSLIVLTGYLLPRVWRRLPSPRSGPDPKGLLARVMGTRRVEIADRTAEPLVWLAGRHLHESTALRWFRRTLVGFFGVMLWVAVMTSHWQEGFIAACCTAYAMHFVSRLQAAWTATRWLHDERRSGALELVLTTPVADDEIVQAHHESLQRVFRPMLRTLVVVNAVLQGSILLFWSHLSMDHRSGTIFSTWFIGGAVMAVADFTVLRWEGLQEALRSPTAARAAGRAFTSLMAGGYVLLAVAILFLVQGQNVDYGFPIFGLWFAGCLFWGRMRIGQCRQALAGGIRALVRPSESGSESGLDPAANPPVRVDS